MNAEDLRNVAAKLPLSKATLARNMTAEAHNAPQVGHYKFTGTNTEVVAKFGGEVKKRIRQGEPKLRPWEREWKESLEASGEWVNVKAQSLRVRLANGAWYKPDVSAYPSNARRSKFDDHFRRIQKIYCWEVKGGAKMKGVAKGILALKVAASQYPEIVWTLCWKERGDWKTQEVLP